ncbi:hypothetical protein [Flavobacterium sp. I3-2]|uniref:hypothetical protein n=1 Tax=Flavobacterium sp. I3-2 TaxID=2748319 RepID=UPI0015B00984|nr:hypothetical protein [Flavobacterium sp. I3-2]
MTILEQLQEFDNFSLTNWNKKSNSFKQNFMDEIVDFANDNEAEFKTYVNNLEPDDSSVLEIIYESLSKYSDLHFDFLRQEMDRLFNLLIKEKVDEDDLDVIDGICIERFYLYDYENFKLIIDNLISKLSPDNTNDMNTFIIETIEDYMIFVTEENQKTDIEKWKKDLYQLYERLERNDEKKLIKEIFNEYKENPVSKFSKIILMCVLLGYSIFLISNFKESLDLSLFNTKRFILLYLGSGFVLSTIFDFTFRIIKNMLLRLIISILILGPIGLNIIFYFINNEKLLFLKEWLFVTF